MVIRNNILDGPTTDLHVPYVLDRTDCGKHDAPVGNPCYLIPKVDDQGHYMGICNTRAKKAGMNGEIKPASLIRFSSRAVRS